MGMELWSGQKTRYVCQTPGHGSQAALMPPTFAFPWSPPALCCSGEGRVWPLGRRKGECKCSPPISAIKQVTVAESTPFHLTSGKIKIFWSSVWVVRGRQQAITNTMRRFSIGQAMWTSDMPMGTWQPIAWKGQTSPFPSSESLNCILRTATPSDGVKSSANGDAYILGIAVIKGWVGETMPLSERERQGSPYQPTFLNGRWKDEPIPALKDYFYQ